MKLLILGLILGIAVYLYLIAPRMSKRREMEPFLGMMWAHRGLHCIRNGIPENSMAAFREAVKGRYGIELDVHLTKDKQLVVFHDDTLERMCGVKKHVEDCAVSELRSLYLGGTSERIPLLSEVLAYVNGRVPLLIEVKLPTKNTEICGCLNGELKAYQGSYLVQSFNSLVLNWYKNHQPDVLRGQLSSNLIKSHKEPHIFIRFCVRYLLSNFYCRPDFISYKLADSSVFSLWLLQRVFRTPSAAWTLRNEGQIREAEKRFDMFIFELLQKNC